MRFLLVFVGICVTLGGIQGRFYIPRIRQLPQPPRPRILPPLIPPPNVPQDILAMQLFGTAVNQLEQSQSEQANIIDSRGSSPDDKKIYGPYVLTNQTLYKEYLEALGTDEHSVTTLLDEKPIVSMEENTRTNRWIITTMHVLPTTESSIKFIEGNAFSEIADDGRICRGTVYREAENTLHQFQKCEPDGVNTEISRVFDENQLIISFSFPGQDKRMCQRVFKAIE